MTTAINQYILDAIDATGYDKTPSTDHEKLHFLLDTFKAEYGWAIERYGFRKAMAEWLAGLPSACNIEWRNHAILELAEQWGVLPVKRSDASEDAFLNRWFDYMACNIVRLLSVYNIHRNAA